MSRLKFTTRIHVKEFESVFSLNRSNERTQCVCVSVPVPAYAHADVCIHIRSYTHCIHLTLLSNEACCVSHNSVTAHIATTFVHFIGDCLSQKKKNKKLNSIEEFTIHNRIVFQLTKEQKVKLRQQTQPLIQNVFKHFEIVVNAIHLNCNLSSTNLFSSFSSTILFAKVLLLFLLFFSSRCVCAFFFLSF